MKEITLLKLALCCSIIGLALLYFLSGYADFSQDADVLQPALQAGENVKVRGTVAKISTKGNAALIELNQEIPLSVVAFGKTPELSEGDYIEVIGKTEEYNGKPEVIASKIRLIPG